jgi:hypothetical protein
MVNLEICEKFDFFLHVPLRVIFSHTYTCLDEIENLIESNLSAWTSMQKPNQTTKGSTITSKHDFNM